MAALRFTASSSTDVVSNPLQTVAVDAQALTVWAWIRPTSFSNGLTLFGQTLIGAAGYRLFTVRTGGLMRVEVDRVTTDLSFTTTTAMTAGQVYFVAYTYDIGAGTANIYLGSPFAPAVEASYGTAQVGTGLTVTNVGGVHRWGRTFDSASAWPGLIYEGGVFLRSLPLVTIRDLQFRPKRYIVEMFDYKLFGVDGDAVALDLSGNGNNGLITGATPIMEPLIIAKVA